MSGDDRRGPRAGKKVHGPPTSCRGSEDPLTFVKPGDHPELDALLLKLRADCDDGDPLYVNYTKRQRALALARRDVGVITGAEAKRAAEAGRAARGGVRGRWLALAALAIVGPVAALGLAVLGRGRAAGRAVSAEMATATATSAGAEAVMVAGDAVMSADTAASVDAVTSSEDTSAEASADTSAGAAAGRALEPTSPAPQAAADARAKAAIAQLHAATKKPKIIDGSGDPYAPIGAPGARPGAAPSATTSRAVGPASPVPSSATKVEPPSAEF